MRFGGRRTSDNVESQRGMSFGRGGGGLGGGAGMLLGLVASRFGIGGVVVLLVVFALFGGLGGLGGGGQQAVAPHEGRQGARGGDVCQSDATTRFSCQVLASTEDQWTRLFAGSGQRYAPPRMVIYDGQGQSGCGSAQSAMGPFYCPADQGIYLDTGFFRELSQSFGAPGDFAQAYVIAHEVGHHVQNLTGTADTDPPRPIGGRRRRGERAPGADGAPGRLLCRSLGGPGAGRDGAGRPRGRHARGRRDRRRHAAACRPGPGRARKLHPRHLGAAPGSADARLSGRKWRRLRGLYFRALGPGGFLTVIPQKPESHFFSRASAKAKRFQLSLE